MDQYVLLPVSWLKKLSPNTILTLAKCAKLDTDSDEVIEYDENRENELIQQLIVYGIVAHDKNYRTMVKEFKADQSMRVRAARSTQWALMSRTRAERRAAERAAENATLQEEKRQARENERQRKQSEREEVKRIKAIERAKKAAEKKAEGASRKHEVNEEESSHSSQPRALGSAAAASSTSASGDYRPTPYEIALWRRRIEDVIRVTPEVTPDIIMSELQNEQWKLFRTNRSDEIDYVRQFATHIIADRRLDDACKERGEAIATGSSRYSWRGIPIICPKQLARKSHDPSTDLKPKKREEWIRSLQWSLDWNPPIMDRTLDDIVFPSNRRWPLRPPQPWNKRTRVATYAAAMRLARRMLLESLIGEKEMLMRVAQLQGREFHFNPALFNDADDPFMCECAACQRKEAALRPPPAPTNDNANTIRPSSSPSSSSSGVTGVQPAAHHRPTLDVTQTQPSTNPMPIRTDTMIVLNSTPIATAIASVSPGVVPHASHHQPAAVRPNAEPIPAAAAAASSSVPHQPTSASTHLAPTPGRRHPTATVTRSHACRTAGEPVVTPPAPTALITSHSLTSRVTRQHRSHSGMQQHGQSSQMPHFDH